MVKKEDVPELHVIGMMSVIEKQNFMRRSMSRFEAFMRRVFGPRQPWFVMPAPGDDLKCCGGCGKIFEVDEEQVVTFHTDLPLRRTTTHCAVCAEKLKDRIDD